MSSLRQVGLGVVAALFSTALIFGSMLLALMEGGELLALAPAPTLTETPAATPKPGEPTFTPTHTLPPTVTPTPTKPVCKNTPSDWVEQPKLPGESLADLALYFGISLDLLLANNCLDLPTIDNYIQVAVPPEPILPTSTLTPTQLPPTPTEKNKEPTRCAHPSGWVAYRVKRGDNLTSIARAYGTTVPRLKAANCLDSKNIHNGQTIYVPGYPAKPPKRPPTSVPRTPRPTRLPPPPAATVQPAEPKLQSEPLPVRPTALPPSPYP
jgi:LysM repeat protein